jgi:hypothetical protein
MRANNGLRQAKSGPQPLSRPPPQRSEKNALLPQRQ